MSTRRARVKRRLLAAPWLPIVAYLAVVAWLGLARGGVAPHALVHTLPPWLVLTWTISIGAGGTLAFVGPLGKGTLVETTGLVLLLWGSVLYGCVLTVSLWPGSLSTILVSAAIAAMCGIRLHILALARHAEKVAKRIADRDERD